MSDNKIAFVFPGQGSQSVGMLAELYAEFDVVKQTFATASEALGYDLWDVVANGPTESLSKTEITQPALLTASVAIFNVLQEKGVVEPAYLAGHSLGEYSALTAAGVLKFEDAVKLVQLRGQLMQQAVPAGVGAMAAVIGLDDQAVIDGCAQVNSDDQVVSAVNFNSPGQVVIAGHKAGVEAASKVLAEAGAKRVLPLPVSVPSHCSLMKPAADKLAEAMESIEFSLPKFAVINNVDVTVSQDASEIKNALVRQLYCPVRWTETVQELAKQGVNQLAEIGPGKVLTGLTKRIDRSVAAAAVNDVNSLENLING